ncbi:MAG: ABC transporter substrate-binding protein [Pseudomonadota bacterium]
MSRLPTLFLAAALVALAAGPAAAQKKYGPGASDTEIRIGQTMPYSGPASAYGTIGRVEAAYFEMLNKEKGGINGRKITFITLDDGYSPPKTVEQVRRLVEQDEVLLIFQLLGTPGNSAVHRYLNAKQVPQLFSATGATKWNDPKNFPWTMGFVPSYQTEAKIYAKYILERMAGARIGVLYQNDDYGKDYLKGLLDGLGDKAKSMVVSQVTYEVTDPTIDSQIVSLKASGANVFLNITTPKFAAMAIRKAHDIDWKPTHFLNSVSNSVAAVLTPAGPDKAVGVISFQYFKDPSAAVWHDGADYKEWVAFMKKYYPDGNLSETLNAYGYIAAKTLEHVLRQSGDDLSRENVMRQAAGIKDLTVPMLLPGIKIDTGPDDFEPLGQGQLIRFDGKQWIPFGGIIGG